MFETLVEVNKERAAARTVMAFPVAVAAQVVLGCSLLLYSIFGAVTLQPPPLLAGWFYETQQVVVPIAKSTGAQNQRQETPRRTEGPVAPAVTPTGIPQPVPQEPGPGTPTDGVPDGVPGGMPLGPGDRPPETPIAAPANVIREPYQVKVPKIVRRVAPEYPPSAIAMGLKGRVVVQLVVNEAGHVVDAQIMSTTNAIFNEAALRAVRQWEFTRPLDAQSQQAVSCYLPVVVSFTLN